MNATMESEMPASPDLNDNLIDAVGVSVQPNNGAFDLFVVRGLDSTNSGSVLIDGVQEPEASFYPTYNVEQIEVLRGPAASLYGGNPLAGAVGIAVHLTSDRRYANDRDIRVLREIVQGRLVRAAAWRVRPVQSTRVP